MRVYILAGLMPTRSRFRYKYLRGRVSGGLDCLPYGEAASEIGGALRRRRCVVI